MKTLWLIPLVALITITQSYSYAENEVSPSVESVSDNTTSESLTVEDVEKPEDDDSNGNHTKRQVPCLYPQFQSQPGEPIIHAISLYTAIPVTQSGQQAVYVSPQSQYPGSGQGQLQYPGSGQGQAQYPGSGQGQSQYPGSGQGQLQYPGSGQGQSQYPGSGTGQSPGFPQLAGVAEVSEVVEVSGLPPGFGKPQVSGVPQNYATQQVSGLPQNFGTAQVSGVPQNFGAPIPQQVSLRSNFPDQIPNIQVQYYDDGWRRFKEIYNKSYPSYEIEAFRKQVFVERSIFITQFNQEFAIGKKSYTLKINKFADSQNEEYYRHHHGFIGGNQLRGSTITGPTKFIYPKHVIIPKSVDWRKDGAVVTRVLEQDRCACCHAISAVGAIEGQYFRKTEKLVEFSVQNIIDCPREKNYQSTGCHRGSVDENFKYVKDNPGIDLEHAYGFEGKDRSCRYRSEAVGTYITGYVAIPERDEKALEAAVATIGPISVGIDANHPEFLSYAGQHIYDGPCSNVKKDINHAVLIVGYDEEANGDKYWIVKNSAGVTWGDHGYMKLAKEKNNTCAVASSAMYPLL